MRRTLARFLLRELTRWTCAQRHAQTHIGNDCRPSFGVPGAQPWEWPSPEAVILNARAFTRARKGLAWSESAVRRREIPSPKQRRQALHSA